MFKLPQDATKINLVDATVDFYKFTKDDLTYYYFDTSLCTPPDPMVNAMVGLQLIDDKNKRLIMINHTIPNALFMRIDANFEYEIEQISGQIRIEFKYKKGSLLETDFSNNKCSG